MRWWSLGLLVAGALLVPSVGGDAAPYSGGDFVLLQAGHAGGGFSSSGLGGLVARGISGGEGGAVVSGGDFSVRPGVRGAVTVEGGDAWLIQ